MGFTHFDVKIVNVLTKPERTCGIQREIVVYEVLVTHAENQWLLHKRYSAFVKFEEELHQRFWYMDIPKLPPKKYFFNQDQAFLETRKNELEKFLQALLKTSCWSQSDKMWDFLTEPKDIVGVPPEPVVPTHGSQAIFNNPAVYRDAMAQAVS